MSFLWNLFQSSQIEKNQAKADLASIKIRTTTADIKRLEEWIEMENKTG